MVLPVETVGPCSDGTADVHGVVTVDSKRGEVATPKLGHQLEIPWPLQDSFDVFILDALELVRHTATMALHWLCVHAVVIPNSSITASF